jgi:hypothetical protein
MLSQIQLRRDTLANWNLSSSVVLQPGEMGLEYPNSSFILASNDNVKIKVGDGFHTWATLPYVNASFSGSSAGSLFATQCSNEILINKYESEISGKQYNKFVNAFAYVSSQTPSATNTWVVRFSGAISESLMVPEFVTVVGDDMYTSIISGSVSFESLGTQILNTNNINNCTIGELIGTSTLPDKQYIGVDNCKILNASGTGSNSIIMNNCLILGGDFSTFDDLCFINNTFVIPVINIATFNGAQFNSCLIVPANTYNKLIVDNCSFTLTSCTSLNDVVFLNTNTFSNCSVNIKNINIDTTLQFLSCTLDGTNITVKSGGDFKTNGSYLEETPTVEAGGVWTNEGEHYDNRTSGLSATNVQTAIDETHLFYKPIPTTYVDLQSSALSGSLKIGKYYQINDFATAHNILNTDDGFGIPIVHTGSIEPIIVLATSSQSIDVNAYSPYYPQDIIHYDMFGVNSSDIGFYNSSSAIQHFKGMITYREDTRQNVSTFYDFRNVVFRRYAINFAGVSNYFQYDVSHSYDENYLTYDGFQYIYVSKKNLNLGNALSDKHYWQQIWDGTTNSKYISPSSSYSLSGISDLPIDTTDYVDEYTFANDYTVVHNVKIGLNNLNKYDTVLNNIVFHITPNDVDACRDSEIKSGYQNTIGNKFINNSIGNNFDNNLFGIDTEYVIIADEFYNNTIQGSFKNNTFDTSIIGNMIGITFWYNVVKSNFYQNKIDSTAEHNLFGVAFAGNKVGELFIWNSTNEGILSNYFGNNVKYNVIEHEFETAVILDDFRFNHIASRCSIYANPLDFTSASHVYGAYDCNIFKKLDGTIILTYMDNSDTWQVVAPTA